MEAQGSGMFRSDIVMDLAAYKEFSNGYLLANTHTRGLKIIFILYILAYILAMGYTGEQGFFPLVALGYPPLWLLTKLLRRGGGSQYKRMLLANGGKPPHNLITVSPQGIHIQNADTGNRAQYAFASIRGLIETENLFILMLQYRMGVILNKHTLAGGSLEGLTAFLQANCPKLKGKRVRHTKNAWLLDGIIFLLLAMGLILSLSLRQANRIQEGAFTMPPMAHYERSLADTAALLMELGIDGIDDSMLQDVEAQLAGLPEGILLDKTALLLARIGEGRYDGAGRWEPSSNTVYSFDMEVLDMGTMYTRFLEGVCAIGQGELAFADIREDTGGVDWEQGTGSRSLSFRWKGKAYTLHAAHMGDWFDLGLADSLNGIIQEENTGKQLYFAGDGYQQCIVFYCDAAWAQRFTEKTGCALSGKILE